MTSRKISEMHQKRGNIKKTIIKEPNFYSQHSPDTQNWNRCLGLILSINSQSAIWQRITIYSWKQNKQLNQILKSHDAWTCVNAWTSNVQPIKIFPIYHKNISILNSYSNSIKQNKWNPEKSLFISHLQQ